MRRTLISICALMALATCALLMVGDKSSQPALRPIGPPPADLHATSVVIPTAGHESVSGWFVRGQPGHGAVLLLHGVRSDRRQMLGRARFLAKAGYSTLLMDLPAPGESAARRITFGAHESIGVRAALVFLRRQAPHERIGVIGVSLGAASFLLANATPAPDAVVLESMYPTISDAVRNRLAIRLGQPGKAFAPLLLWQLEPVIGVKQELLRPIERIPHLRSPVLIAGGSLDQHTTLGETRRIYAAARQPKELWIVRGAAHVDLQSYDPLSYKAHILSFLARHLRSRPTAPSAPVDSNKSSR